MDAVRRLAEGGPVDPETARLVAGGSTPGEARPKASVLDGEGHLAIAKFPRRSDPIDVSGWEATVAELSRRAGITTPPFEFHRIDRFASVFVTRRFDRSGARRLGYWSLRTLFQLSDDARPDYASIARAITSLSDDPAADGEELFRRAALSAMVGNTDDHLRNHGVLWRGERMRLAPAFDINPLWPGEPGTPLIEGGSAVDRDPHQLVAQAHAFRLDAARAAEVLQEVSAVVGEWREIASGFDIDPSQSTRMAAAFRPAR